MNEVYTQTCWIVTVDGKPTDIRATSDLATRQARVQKTRSPNSQVELHYSECSSRGRYDGQKLVVDITAPAISEYTHIATINA